MLTAEEVRQKQTNEIDGKIAASLNKIEERILSHITYSTDKQIIEEVPQDIMENVKKELTLRGYTVNKVQSERGTQWDPYNITVLEIQW